MGEQITSRAHDGPIARALDAFVAPIITTFQKGPGTTRAVTAAAWDDPSYERFLSA